MNTRRGFLASVLTACTALIVRPTMALERVHRSSCGWRSAKKIFSGAFITFGQIKRAVQVAVFADRNPKALCELILTDWSADRNAYYLPLPPTAATELTMTFDSIGQEFKFYSVHYMTAEPPTS